jgi:hypothetical protein
MSAGSNKRGKSTKFLNYPFSANLKGALLRDLRVHELSTWS